MTAQDIFTTILRVTFTKSEFLHRIDLLRSYFENILYSTGQNLTLSSFLENTGVSEYERNILTSITDDFAPSIDRENAPRIIADLKNKMEALPELTLFLPFHPSQEEITRLGIWCRGNINDSVLIDVRIDKEAIAGCALVWKGVHHDYTLAYFMEKNREKILELLNPDTPYFSKSKRLTI